MVSAAVPFEAFSSLTAAACDEYIVRAKKQLGQDLLILGHHYQRDEVYKHADCTGDSLGLSRQAAASQAKFIVFCGVHFMAEVSAILTSSQQVTILPDLAAGCSMADMANLASVERAWREMQAVLDPDALITPITYVNSSADLKAFCGRHGGIVCTSTNARQIIDWAFSQRQKVLFFPDQHLGRNTCYRMGVPLDKMALWDFAQPQGGLTAAQMQDATVLLWKGHCSVHAKFQPEHIDDYLARYPETFIIAHPEASFEVCEKAHYMGSTSYIIKTIQEAPANSRWLVATELNLVQRLHQQFQHEGKTVKFMAPSLSMCSTMYRTDPQHLAWVLENLRLGQVVNQITVPAQVAQQASIALERMFKIS